LIIATSKRSDVHFLGLLTQLIFVIEHGSDDEEIATDDDDNGTEVLEETRRQDETFVVHRRRVRVVGTPIFQKDKQ
jgi:hypothetical protein